MTEPPRIKVTRSQSSREQCPGAAGGEGLLFPPTGSQKGHWLQVLRPWGWREGQMVSLGSLRLGWGQGKVSPCRVEMSSSATLPTRKHSLHGE